MHSSGLAAPGPAVVIEPRPHCRFGCFWGGGGTAWGLSFGAVKVCLDWLVKAGLKAVRLADLTRGRHHQ